LLFSISRAAPFLVDAMSYLVSLAALLFIRTRLQGVRTSAPGRLLDEIAEGLRVVWNEPFLRTSVMVIAGMNFVFNAATLVLIVRAQDLGASPALIGGMFAFFGAGALVGSIVAPWVERTFDPRRTIVTIAWFWVLEFAALVVMPTVLALGVVAGLGALGGPPFNVVIGNILYRVTPDRLLGRVRSAARLVAWGSIPLGSLAAGFLAGGLGAATALLALAACMLPVALATTFAPGMRRLPASLGD
jgi:Na+/melibiose symporter-like transporter